MTILEDYKNLQIGDIVREGDLTYNDEGGWHRDDVFLGTEIANENQAKCFIRKDKPEIDRITRGESASGYLKELCLYYPNDKIAPGLQSAWLPDKGFFYVAIHRFPKPTVESRSIIAKAMHVELEQAEKDCMDIWRNLCRQIEASRVKPN